MRLTSALTLCAMALAGVEATKPVMQAGRLTLQDLLALRNGVVFPAAELCECHACAKTHVQA